MQTKLRIFLATLITLSCLGLANSIIAQPQGGMGGGGGGPDFSEAAETLGVTEDVLRDALGGQPPNIAEAAEKLGISEEKLLEVIPPPPEGGRQ